MFENNPIRYKIYRNFLEKYWKIYERNKYKALKKMANLYIKLSDTYFHDLVTNIELHFDEYELWKNDCGEKIEKYIIKKNNKNMNVLLEVIEKDKNGIRGYCA